jgi:ABC-type multidrug transport system fused ATPase/permease subunit
LKQPIEKKNPLLYLFGKTWHYSEGNRKKIVLYWIMFILAESIDVFAMPMVWAKMIDIISLQGLTTESLRGLDFLLSLVIIRVIVTWSLHGPARTIECANSFKATMNYRGFLMKGLLTLPLDWHIDHHSGDTIDKIGKGTNALRDFSEDSFEVIYCLVRLFGCYGMLAYFSHSSSYIILVMMTISALITMRFDKYLIGKYREINQNENEVAERISDIIQNISTVIILRVEDRVFDAIMKKVEKPFKLIKKTNRVGEWKWFLTSFCCCIMTISVLRFYFWQNLGARPGAITASVYLLISYLNKIGDLFFRFCSMYGEIIKRKTRIENSEQIAKNFGKENFTNHILPKDWKILEIKKLNLTHKGVADNVLHLDNVSLSIRRGEKIVFVGETGSGKTTMLKVMRDLCHPKSFELFVDGQIIPDGFPGIARDIALVQQKPELFGTTNVRENITVWADYGDSFIRKFTDMACFTEVIDGLPNGLESSVKEDGLDLSGGQQQRLALSRGLLACHNKGIILLDEPTSSLDKLTEISVYQNIFGKFQDKTIIATTHGLHLLPLFDRICFFDKGRILANGTLKELLISCPQFVSLWEAMKCVTENNIGTK